MVLPRYFLMRVAYLLGRGVFMLPIPINYLHVKHIDPLLVPASELSVGRAENRTRDLVLSSGSPFRFHALAGTLKVMMH